MGNRKLLVVGAESTTREPSLTNQASWPPDAPAPTRLDAGSSNNLVSMDTQTRSEVRRLRDYARSDR